MGTRSMVLPLDGGTAHFCELLIAVLMQTPPSFPRGVKKKESEFGAEQTGVQILSLLLTSSVILEKPLILSKLLFIHL